MANKSIIAVIVVLISLGSLSIGCKKGCGTCRSYGYTSGVNNTYQGYSAQVCANSFCTCANGFEGDSCQVYSYLKYVNPSQSWSVTDNCSGNTNYFVTFYSNYPSYNTILISNLFNSGAQITANILSSPNNTSSLYIQQQTVGTIVVSGSGSYSSNGLYGRLTLNLDFNNNGIDQSCILYLYQQ
jgi:hypothetical protein